MNERDIFIAALQKPIGPTRTAYLAEVCAEQPELRAKVEELLKLYENAESFLETPAPPPSLYNTVDALASAEAPGTVIGRYKLFEQIGEGGMGTVWMAQQTEPVKRPVAVKLIKPGMDSKQVLARFDAERQALAMMDHTNIARVFDAGTTPESRPYFVMELVKGVPITKYCDEQRLTTRQRLELFVHVCQAIQHAHQKGIIHRDIKPSNVLVVMCDDKPVPKVIDFGVAKAVGQQLTEQTLHTGLGTVVGTVEYMSPEQAGFNQLDIDTRSDIYSLGVLLYELLAGSPPFSRKELEKAGMFEMLRVIREQEPSKPSTRLSTADGLPTLAVNRGTEPKRLTALVRGEIDWIVMKGLEKDRNRRYETATSFAADVQRYLNDEPVQACPPSPGYRFRKFARRNGRILATTGLIAVTLLVAAVVSTWQAVRARDAQRQAESDRDRAETAQRQAEAAERRAANEAAIARAVNEFLQGDLLGQVNTFGGDAKPTLREALDRAAARIGDRFRDQPLFEAAVRKAIGEAYHSLHDNKLAVAHFERAVALLQAHLGSDNPDIQSIACILADQYTWVGRHAEAIALWQQILEKRKVRLGLDNLETLAAMDSLAVAYRNGSQWDTSVQLLEQVLEKRRAICGPTHPSMLGTMHALAMNYEYLGRFAESMALYERLLNISKTLNGSENISLTWPMMTYAQVCLRAGKLDRAEQLLREVLEQLRKQKPSFTRQRIRSDTLGWLALNMYLKHSYADAESLIRETLAYQMKELPDSPRTFYWISLLGAVLLGQERFAEAEPLILQGYEGMKQREATHFCIRVEVADAAERVVRFYEVTKQPERARMWREKVNPKLMNTATPNVK
jgi:serine/threonine protein kinase/tetratricopeptide (TPR) repeat protein